MPLQGSLKPKKGLYLYIKGPQSPRIQTFRGGDEKMKYNGAPEESRLFEAAEPIDLLARRFYMRLS